MRLFFAFTLLASTFFMSGCTKDETDTSGGSAVNFERKLEMDFDGDNWDTDEVYMQTYLGDLYVHGENVNTSTLDMRIIDFQGTGTYTLDGQSYAQYISQGGLDEFNSTSGTVVVTSFGTSVLNGSFNFEGNSGGETMSFTNGLFDGIDSLANVPTEVIDVQKNGTAIGVFNIDLQENTGTNQLVMLSQVRDEDATVVIRIPTALTPDTYDIFDQDIAVEYLLLNSDSYSASLGEMVITANDTNAKVLSGYVQGLTLDNDNSSDSIELSVSFDLNY